VADQHHADRRSPDHVLTAEDGPARPRTRVPFGTPYPLVVERVAAIVSLFRQCSLIVDAAGIGEPVVDSLRRTRLGCTITSVTITGGQKESRRPQNPLPPAPGNY